jgi:hypothetical protein
LAGLLVAGTKAPPISAEAASNEPPLSIAPLDVIV